MRKSKGGRERQPQKPPHSPPGPPSPSSNSKKKRPRPDAPSTGDGSTSVAPHAVQWLEKRKMKVPDALRGDGGASTTTMEEVLRLLPGLRERERRALVRHVDKCASQNGGDEAKKELEGSDGEYDINEKGGSQSTQSAPGDEWPKDVQFSNDYHWDDAVPAEVREKYAPPNRVRKRAARFSHKVYFRRISDPDHPAHGEFGLYCALDRIPPGAWLLDYVGRVMRGEDQDKQSDYVSDFGEKSELACDANKHGNEARFLNDFRNTGKFPNVEFNLRRDKNGELRQGVYVKLAKDARRPGFDGVRKDEELLVSYGKSYWRSRAGNLTDFVWRIPGAPMPEGGKPKETSGHERKEG